MAGGAGERRFARLHRDSEDTAKANADALTMVFDGAWWSQQVELDQVNVDGVVVTATMIGLPATVSDCGFDRQLFARHP